MNKNKTIVLLSGGLDSATVLAMVKDRGDDIYALSFDYGQRHKAELIASQKLAANYQVTEHKILNLDLRQLGGSALTDNIDVPKNEHLDDMDKGIPVTYVPARNTIFLSYALAWADVIGAGRLCIGVNALDYSGYPDCRPEYIQSFQTMANLATKRGVEKTLVFLIETPLIDMTKAEIIQKGIALGVDYGMTSSCYDPNSNGKPCGHCDSCLLRKKGFIEAGAVDPIY